MKLRSLVALTLGACAGATTLLATSSAQAYEPAQVHEGASVGALIGFGENEFLFTTGLRGGYTLPGSHVYLGGTFLFNAGSSSYCGYYGAVTTYYCYGGNSVGFLTGFEAGYEFAAGPILVRPYGGVGVAFDSYSFGGYGCNEVTGVGCGVGPGYYAPSSNTSSVALWGGGTAMYDFKNHGPWFVMGDMRIGDAPFLFDDQFLFMFLVGGGYEF
jgi:hypothetical protein